MRRVVTTDPEVLSNALLDAINAYNREVIVGLNLVEGKKLEILDSLEVKEKVVSIVDLLVENWKSCIIEDI
jgi:hypothetical protein